jgi:hypothetical protein
MRTLIKRILRRLKYELSEFSQNHIPRNSRYKPKGVANIDRVNRAESKYFEIRPPHSSELQLSPEFVKVCSPYIKPVMKIDTPGDFVLALKNGRIYSSDHSNFATISQDGYVLEEVSFQWGLMEERILEAKKNRVFKTKGFTKPNVYRGKVFSLLSGGGAKYYLYHWLTEAIPKMYLFQQSGLLDHNSHFIIPSQQFSYHQEYLKYFGIGKDRIIDEQSVHHIQADWLYVTSHVKYFDHHPNWSLDFL